MTFFCSLPTLPIIIRGNGVWQSHYREAQNNEFTSEYIIRAPTPVKLHFPSMPTHSPLTWYTRTPLFSHTTSIHSQLTTLHPCVTPKMPEPTPCPFPHTVIHTLAHLCVHHILTLSLSPQHSFTQYTHFPSHTHTLYLSLLNTVKWTYRLFYPSPEPIVIRDEAPE